MKSPPVPIRFVDELHHASRIKRLRARADIEMARVIDAALARAGLAKPSVFVSGFWRSGTTWMQECLAEALRAKTVFEPLSPLDPTRRAVVARLFGADEDASQAYIPEVSDGDDAVLKCLDPAMQGRANSAFSLSCRTSMSESFRRRIVVKDVRAQCLLGLIHARYGVPVIHLRRHPCAVVSSLKRAKWHWSFERVSLQSLISHTALPSGIADFRVFDTDDVSRTAFCWALSERRAAEHLSGQSWGRLISYEAFAREPAREFAGLCASLGLEARHEVAFDQPSASIHPDEFAARGTTTDRWRRHLSASDIARIEAIASEVFPSWRDLF